MTNSSLFNLDRFLSLSGSELFEYVEPFVNMKLDSIPESVYEPLKSKLSDLDEYHLVYALEICMALKPSEFSGIAVEFLSHSDSSVCSAAYNVLNNLPAKLMTADLVERIAVTPVVDLLTVHVRTGEIVRIGTNEEFIRRLLERTS